MPHQPRDEDRDIAILKLKAVESLIQCLEAMRSQLELDVLKAGALHPFDPSAQALFLSRAEIRPGEFVPSHSLIDADLELAARSLGDGFFEKKKRADEEFRDLSLAVGVLARQGAGPEASGPFVVEFLRAAAALIRIGLQPALHLRRRLLDRLERTEPVQCDGEPTGRGASGRTGKGTSLFRRKGGNWTVRFLSGEPFALKANAGAAYVHFLLSRPDQAVSAADLDAYWSSFHTAGRPAPAAGEIETDRSGHDGPVLDKLGLRNCREEYERIEDELADAERNHDLGRIAALKAERQQLAGHVSRATKPGGRPVLVGDQQEKVTDRVTQAIRRTIKVIQKEDAALSRHLKMAIRTGTVCRYTPESSTLWEL